MEAIPISVIRLSMCKLTLCGGNVAYNPLRMNSNHGPTTHISTELPPNLSVFSQPKMGNAIFFSYIDPESKVMDNGFTEHSGCPVYEGEKKIVTQWIRYGVDKENPWDSFNTLGIKKSEENDY